jgi:type IV pilus assembly protein PilA
MRLARKSGRNAPRHSLARGFTILEVMIVVAVLGVLAAVAVPAFVRYSRRAKTTEAVDKLAHLYRMSAAYWAADGSTRLSTAAAAARSFPASTGPTPADVPAGTRVVDAPGTWSSPTWQALNFSITDPHYFSYEYASEGSNASAAFTARALGDLDGNGVYSTFERAGTVTPNLEVQGSDGLWMDREIE